MSEGESVYEMLWDCRYCDTSKLLGLTHRHCPRCGAPQNPEARYFPAEHEKVPAREHVYYGADVRCGACHEANSRKNSHCRGCGAPLVSAAEVVRKADTPQPTPSAPMQGLVAEPARSKGKKGSWLGVGCLTVLGAIGAGTGLSMLWKKDAALELVGHEWQRAIHIERFAPHETASWCDGLPRDARVTRRTREVRSHHKVPDGESCHTRREDQGDGTYRELEECSPRYRDEPEYDQRCHYMVLRWSDVRVAEREGKSVGDYPAWPAVGPLRSCASEGCEREGKREESYTLVFRDAASEEHRCEVSQASWAGLALGSSVKGKVSVVTGALDCASLGLR